MRNYTELVDLAEAAANRAADFIRAADRPDRASDWDTKGHSDYVTRIDRQAEELVSESLSAAEPDSVIVGEELTPERQGTGLTWVVDPLDGTTNYLHRFPSYAVSIAALLDGEPVAGVVHDIPGRVSYTATKGGGAWLNGERLAVSDLENPKLALVGTGFPFKRMHLMDSYVTQFRRILESTSGVRRTGSAAIDLAMIAAGVLDCFWELYLAPWDVAAGVLLVREAGGRVTDPRGDSSMIRHGAVVAGNPKLHSWLLSTLQGIA